MIRTTSTCLTAALLLFLGLTVSAHHGQAGLFDDARIVELKGTVKKWSLTNPHPILVLEAADEKGVKVEWDVYFGPSAAAPLRRQGYTPQTFKPGDTVIVKGHPSTGAGTRGVDVSGRGTGVTRDDGTKIP